MDGYPQYNYVLFGLSKHPILYSKETGCVYIRYFPLKNCLLVPTKYCSVSVFTQITKPTPIKFFKFTPELSYLCITLHFLWLDLQRENFTRNNQCLKVFPFEFCHNCKNCVMYMIVACCCNKEQAL